MDHGRHCMGSCRHCDSKLHHSNLCPARQCKLCRQYGHVQSACPKEIGQRGQPSYSSPHKEHPKKHKAPRAAKSKMVTWGTSQDADDDDSACQLTDIRGGGGGPLLLLLSQDTMSYKLVSADSDDSRPKDINRREMYLRVTMTGVNAVFICDYQVPSALKVAQLKYVITLHPGARDFFAEAANRFEISLLYDQGRELSYRCLLNECDLRCLVQGSHVTRLEALLDFSVSMRGTYCPVPHHPILYADPEW